MEKIEENISEIKKENSSNNKAPESNLNWAAILFYLYLHVIGIAGFHILLTKAKWMTLIYFVFLTATSYIGLTIGAHRYYAHQSFAASWQFRLFVFIAHTIAGVGPIYNWVFYHRVHHRYHNTEYDPYNHKKGFLYSHVIGNMFLVPSHVKTKYEIDIDMRDVDEDDYVWIQKKLYWILFIIFGLLLPINIPIEFWDESLLNAFLIIGAARLTITTHFAWLLNSAVLVWGLTKEDRYPVNDNSVFFISKSYWLNYHYLVSWDWKTDELGCYENGFATFFLKIFRELGFVDQMKTNSSEDVRKILWKITNNEKTMKEALDELKQIAEETAHRERLVFHH
ncbi:acyl-CoA Delta(11) desaturase-like [Pseudomyrmex gracilis]|uniref:acyl-CoA Delta(11) desaturase-like n=1 Tax=Pseudomyrmex gracilis TaxID=219809 RepID=UPI000995DCD7|nr:acyl-CoA Delta(11) desaturase-like [Pseudomyrmex gracilis]XP_020286516.1 acyl-CoA Delta(11) desaturase-like [Pseudomyrmex gracilis]